MKKKLDKPLIGLGVVGIIGGAVVFHCFDVKVFCLAALFWLLVCYLWQNTRDLRSPWYRKLLTVFTEAVLWALTAGGWYILGYAFSWLMGWQNLPILCIIEGAVLHLMGWQLYDLGISNRWWIDLRQYLFYVVITLGGLSMAVLLLRNLFNT